VKKWPVVPVGVDGKIAFGCWIWRSLSGAYEEYYLLGCEDSSSNRNLLTFRRNISISSNEKKKGRKFTSARCLLLAYLVYSLILKMVALCSSETSVGATGLHGVTAPKRVLLIIRCMVEEYSVIMNSCDSGHTRTWDNSVYRRATGWTTGVDSRQRQVRSFHGI
jgi:hypothetical protein